VVEDVEEVGIVAGCESEEIVVGTKQKVNKVNSFLKNKGRNFIKYQFHRQKRH
jgi:hypothetical protein